MRRGKVRNLNQAEWWIVWCKKYFQQNFLQEFLQFKNIFLSIYLFIYFNWFMVHLFLSKQFSGLLVWNIYILELSQRGEVEMRFKCFEWSGCKLLCSKPWHRCRGGGAVCSSGIMVIVIQNSVTGEDALGVKAHYQWVHIAVPIVPPVTFQGVLHNILRFTQSNPHVRVQYNQSSPRWAASS